VLGRGAGSQRVRRRHGIRLCRLLLKCRQGSRIFEGKTVNFREQYGRATREVPVEGDESGL
jgi:hypothetical protein